MTSEARWVEQTIRRDGPVAAYGALAVARSWWVARELLHLRHCPGSAYREVWGVSASTVHRRSRLVSELSMYPGVSPGDLAFHLYREF